MTRTPLWLQLQRGEITEEERAEASERRRQAFAAYEDTPISGMLAHILFTHFESPEEIMETPDRELMALHGVGQRNFAMIRSLFPNRHPHPPDCPKAGKWVYCPYCGAPL